MTLIQGINAISGSNSSWLDGNKDFSQEAHTVICFYMWAKWQLNMSSAVFCSPSGSRVKVWSYLKLLTLTEHHQDLLSKTRGVSQGIRAAALVMARTLAECFTLRHPSWEVLLLFCWISSAQRALELLLCSLVFLANRNTPDVSYPRSEVSPLSISSAATSTHTETHLHI